MTACGLFLAELGKVCGSTDDVDRYLPGFRCRPHSPRSLAGTPDPTPPGWPAALTPRPVRTYGTKRDDPLGRTIYPKGAKYGIPSHECPECPGRPKGHKLPHGPA